MNEHDDLPEDPGYDSDDGVGEVDFWGQCSLTRIMTEPPRYELQVPGGKKIMLRTQHFFEPSAFSVVFIDAVGEFPPLPEKKPAAFLRDTFRALLSRRTDLRVADEASDRGTLLSDIRMGLMACPQSDDPQDIDRGAVFVPPGEPGAWVSARSLMARVQRACPVRFSPADFYAALVSVGMVNLDVKRHEGWRGRVWMVPADLMPTLESEPRMKGLPAPEPTQGAFDDLLAQ